MRLVSFLISFFLPIVIGTNAVAQNNPGQQIFDIFRGQLDREINRQQQRAFEKQQQHQNEAMRQAFLAVWDDCFQSSNIARCDEALSYPNLVSNDRQRLLDQRAAIVTELQDQARQREAEANAAQAAEDARAQQEQRAQQMAREREIGRANAEADRLKEARQEEERRLADLRDYNSALDGCRRGEIGACEAALASPAANDTDRTLLAQWRSEASPLYRARAAVTDTWTQASTTGNAFFQTIEDLPLSTKITGSLATVLSLALVAVTVRQSPPQPAPSTLAAVEKAVPKGRRNPYWRMWRSFVKRRSAQKPASNTATPPAPPSHDPITPPPLPEASTALVVQTAEAKPPLQRDTPAAIIALQIAHSYIDEVETQPSLNPEDVQQTRELLNTLALATKQLTIAEAKDPDAVLEVKKNDLIYDLTQANLKAHALTQEAFLVHMTDPRRAVKALDQAIQFTPDEPRPYYIMGIIHSQNRNPGRATTALAKAVELDPANIEYRKALDRAANISGTEVVGYKVTRTGERVYDTAVGVANTSIKAWNIFATVYNIVTFPIRMPLKVINWMLKL